MHNINKDDPWSFPDVEFINSNELSNYFIDSDSMKLIKEISELKSVIENKDKKIDEMNIQLSNIQNDMKQKIDLMNDLYEKLSSTVPVMNDLLLKMMTAIISKIVKKIIHKEISKDNNALKEIIENLIENTNSEGMVVIELSENDYNLLHNFNFNNVKLKSNKNLNRGTFIIINNSMSYIQEIDRYIDNIMGKSYES